MKRAYATLLMVLMTAASAQSPVPRSLSYPRELVWKALLATLQEQGWKVDRADAEMGIITTVSAQARALSSASFQPSTRTIEYQKEYERQRDFKETQRFWTVHQQASLDQSYRVWQDSLQAERAEFLARLSVQNASAKDAVPIGLTLLLRSDGAASTVTINVSVTSAWSEFITCSSNGSLEERIMNDLKARLLRSSKS